MKKLLLFIIVNCLTGLAYSQYVFTNLTPESGSVKDFFNSKGINIKGKVLTTNEVVDGFSFLAFGENGTNRTPFIYFDKLKELRKKKQRIGYKFKAHNVGNTYSPLGFQSYYSIYFLIVKMNGETEYAYTTVTNSTVK